MAGLSFLYAFFYLSSAEKGTSYPTVEEAIKDVESCLSILQYSARACRLTPVEMLMGLVAGIPSSSAYHETIQSISFAIFEELDDPTAAGSRGARLSSARKDRIPGVGFSAIQPPAKHPYELSLLDKLFSNPLAYPHKASNYTNGKKNDMALPGRPLSVSGAPGNSFMTEHTGSTPGASHPGHNVFEPYGMVAVGWGYNAGTSTSASGFDYLTENSNDGTAVSIRSGHPNETIIPNAGGDEETEMSQSDPDVDIFNFLNKGQGDGGAESWDGLDIPTDFSLWN